MQTVNLTWKKFKELMVIIPVNHTDKYQDHIDGSYGYKLSWNLLRSQC